MKPNLFKLIVVLLTVATLVVGCAPTAPPAAPEPTKAPEQAAPEAPEPTKAPEPAKAPEPTKAPVAAASLLPQDQQKYYFLAANIQDPFYVPGSAGWADGCKSLGVKCEFLGPLDNNTAAQMKTWEELLAKPDTAGIFWYPTDFNAGEPLIKQSKAQGVALVIGAADSPEKTRDSFIGYDNNGLGASAAEVVVKALNGKGKVGSMGNLGPNVVQRQEAFRAYLKEKYPDITTVEATAHEGSVDSATKSLSAYMTAHPDLDMIWFADGLAGSMAQVWKEYQQQGTKTLFLSMDMPPNTLQAVKDGIFYATIGQDTYTEAYWGSYITYLAYQGLRVPDAFFLKTLIIDKSNVDQFMTK